MTKSDSFATVIARVDLKAGTCTCTELTPEEIAYLDAKRKQLEEWERKRQERLRRPNQPPSTPDEPTPPTA